jgi:hypothetical protein
MKNISLFLAVFLAHTLLITTSFASGPSVNHNSEKMCVCEVCGGAKVPCRDMKEPYLKDDSKVTPTAAKVKSAQDK